MNPIDTRVEEQASRARDGSSRRQMEPDALALWQAAFDAAKAVRHESGAGAELNVVEAPGAMLGPRVAERMGSSDARPDATERPKEAHEVNSAEVDSRVRPSPASSSSHQDDRALPVTKGAAATTEIASEPDQAPHQRSSLPARRSSAAEPAAPTSATREARPSVASSPLVNRVMPWQHPSMPNGALQVGSSVRAAARSSATLVVDSPGAQPGQPETVEPRDAALLHGTSVAANRSAAEANEEPMPAPSSRSARAQAETPIAEESVHVFQSTQGIDVIVRHSGLSAQAAVWCAMETARQLTGDRRALANVTLNGRTVYEGQAPTSPAHALADARAQSHAIVFSC